MPPLPTIPFVGGPFDGQRRPIIGDCVPELVERRVAERLEIEVYELKQNHDGTSFLKYKGARPITVKK